MLLLDHISVAYVFYFTCMIYTCVHPTIVTISIIVLFNKKYEYE